MTDVLAQLMYRAKKDGQSRLISINCRRYGLDSNLCGQYTDMFGLLRSGFARPEAPMGPLDCPKHEISTPKGNPAMPGTAWWLGAICLRRFQGHRRRGVVKQQNGRNGPYGIKGLLAFQGLARAPTDLSIRLQQRKQSMMWWASGRDNVRLPKRHPLRKQTAPSRPDKRSATCSTMWKRSPRHMFRPGVATASSCS